MTGRTWTSSRRFLRRRVGDPFMLARRLAVRLCDEAGELLFDASNEDDLKAINALDGSVLDVLRVELDRETAAKKLGARRRFQLQLSFALAKHWPKSSHARGPLCRI